MMWSFGALCDEFYVNSRLYFKLELDPSRDSLLHFFEQIRRAFPQLSRLRRRDDGTLLLEEEEEPDGEGRYYVRLDANALKFGCHSPSDAEQVDRLAKVVLTQAPYQLSLSDLDYYYMEFVYTFDLEYRGNHDELVADTLFADHPLMTTLVGEGQRVIDCQPFLGVTLTPDCEKQLYMEIKGRTSSHEVRSGDYEPAPLSVYVTVRRYWSRGGPTELPEAHHELVVLGEQMAAERVVPHVIQPLIAAIASRR